MHTRIISGMGLVLACCVGSAAAQDPNVRARAPSSSASALVSFGAPEPLADGGPASAPPQAAPAPNFVRMQVGDPPPAPAFPGSPSPAFIPVPPGASPYNGGVVNNDSDLGGFWTQFGDKVKHCWSDVTGSIGGNSNHKMFQSDNAFPGFASPVSNPFYFEDPRSLTEFRPVFVWQHTPNSNPTFNGGNNFAIAATGSVAFTENISLVINRLGFDWIDPRSPSTLKAAGGFSDILLGPKITFLRNETSGTVAAAGLTFDIPAGETKYLQDTGHLMLTPYLSVAQSFGRSSYGTFNFMNTTGYDFRTDNTRTESLFSSFHLDYDVANLHRFFPLFEINWRLYTRSGGENDFNFEGGSLANFGSEHVAGLNDLNLAVGTRIVINDHIQWGIALEFNVLGDGNGGRHLDEFTLTTDFIFRY